jgi:hypothetical protein
MVVTPGQTRFLAPTLAETLLLLHYPLHPEGTPADFTPNREFFGGFGRSPRVQSMKRKRTCFPDVRESDKRMIKLVRTVYNRRITGG